MIQKFNLLSKSKKIQLILSIVFTIFKSETFSPITDGTNVTAYDGTVMTDDTPYVTSSPKMQISDSQFLTGDGVSAVAYGNSTAKNILDDIIAGTSAKRYKNTTLSNTVNGTTSSLTASAFSAQLASKKYSGSATNKYPYVHNRTNYSTI